MKGTLGDHLAQPRVIQVRLRTSRTGVALYKWSNQIKYQGGWLIESINLHSCFPLLLLLLPVLLHALLALLLLLLLRLCRSLPLSLLLLPLPLLLPLRLPLLAGETNRRHPAANLAVAEHMGGVTTQLRRGIEYSNAVLLA
jgi:hypothetical protein